MKKLLTSLCLVSVLSLVGCAGLSVKDTLTKAESAAWTGINALETINTATGGVFTTAAVDYALSATHNSGDEAIVNAAVAAGNKVIAAQAAAHVTGANNQVIATTVLNDPNTVAVATAAAQKVITVTSTSKATLFVHSKNVTDLRPIYGWNNAYDLSIRKHNTKLSFAGH